MYIKEISGATNFALKNNMAICVCVSADSISDEYLKIYNMVRSGTLGNHYGDCLFSGKVFSLIVKEKESDGVDAESFAMAAEQVAVYMKYNNGDDEFRGVVFVVPQTLDFEKFIEVVNDKFKDVAKCDICYLRGGSSNG